MCKFAVLYYFHTHCENEKYIKLHIEDVNTSILTQQSCMLLSEQQQQQKTPQASPECKTWTSCMIHIYVSLFTNINQPMIPLSVCVIRPAGNHLSIYKHWYIFHKYTNPEGSNRRQAGDEWLFIQLYVTNYSSHTEYFGTCCDCGDIELYILMNI